MRTTPPGIQATRTTRTSPRNLPGATTLEEVLRVLRVLRTTGHLQYSTFSLWKQRIPVDCKLL